MAESRQQKAKRLVTEHFNEHLQTEETGEAKPDDVAIFMTLTQPPASKNWIIVMILKKPVVMYWEVHYNKKEKFAEVRPFGPLRQGFYPDEPAPAKLKVVRP